MRGTCTLITSLSNLVFARPGAWFPRREISRMFSKRQQRLLDYHCSSEICRPAHSVVASRGEAEICCEGGWSWRISLDQRESCWKMMHQAMHGRFEH